MEEKTIIEVTEADFDSFEDGWDDETVVPDEDDDLLSADEETEVSEGDGEPVAEEPDGDDAAEEPQTETENEAQPADHSEQPEVKEPERFTLKHLDNRYDVTLEEMRSLASKGLDYDRTKQKVAEYEAFFKEISDGKTPQELMDAVRAARLAKEKNIDQDTALERVKVDRERAQLDEEKAAANKAAEEKQRRSADIADFAKRYPDVKAQDIPREVWDAVNKGQSLSSAYATYETKALRERIKALEAEKLALQQNEKNKERTAGSRATAGNKQIADPFDEGWDD